MSRPAGRFARLLLPCFVVPALLGLPPAARAASDWVPGSYMTQAISRVMSSVRKITEKTEYGLDDGSTCFIAAYLAEGAEAGQTMPLIGGRSYAFLGGGDDDVKDLDLFLKDSEGNVVERDVATDANPVIVFTPREDGKYRLVMKLASDKVKGSYCAFAVLRDGGFDVPASNLVTSYATVIALCTSIDKKLGPASFRTAEGEITLVGTILNEGETLTQRGIGLGDGRYAFCAGADGRANDIDLKLLDESDEVVETDTATDATPILLHEQSGTMKLKITDVKSDGATLAIAAILKLGK